MTTIRDYFARRRRTRDLRRLRLRVVEVFVGSQAGFDWILCDIFSEPLELRFVANEMVEGILLPEATVGPQAAVDLGGRKVLPRGALRHHRGLVGKCCEQVNVVGHHDAIEQFVPIAVEVP